MKFLPALAISFGVLYLGSVVLALGMALSFQVLAVWAGAK